MKSSLPINSPKTNNFMKASVPKFSICSFNPVHMIPKTNIECLKRDAEILLKAPENFELIWKDLMKTQISTGGLIPSKVMEYIFETHQQNIKEVLRIPNSTQFFEIFDEDNDGYLNEDEQIMIFSMAKHKMKTTADEVCKIQEYTLFKNLMKKVREFELKISEYQNHLRQNIYMKQNKIYKDIGNEKLDEFYRRYDMTFRKFNERKIRKITEMRMKHHLEKQELECKLSDILRALKYKPDKKLKQYQDAEKLLIIAERVEEAQNYRRELNHLEEKERERVERNIADNEKKQMYDLELKHKKEERHMQLKLQNKENAIIIELQKEFDMLQKKIHVHENEIKLIQNLASKYSMKRAIEEPELKRTKERSEEQNDLISRAKKIREQIEDGTKKSKKSGDTNTNEEGGYMIRVSQSSPSRASHIKIQVNNRNEGEDGGKMPESSRSEGLRSPKNMMKIFKKVSTMAQSTSQFIAAYHQGIVHNFRKEMKSKDVVRFYIRNQFGADRPINEKKNVFEKDGGMNEHLKIEKFLKDKKKTHLETLPTLTDLYDEDLNLIGEITLQSEDNEDAKRRRRKNVNQYLNAKSPFGSR